MVSSSPSITGWKFRDFKILSMSAVGTSIPSTPFTFLMLAFISVGSMELPVFASTWVEDTLPQPSSSIRCSALLLAITVAYSSTPLAYLWEESEDCPSALELLRILSLANFADSKMTASVVSRISEFKPPMIPASATGFTPSQMTRLFSFNSNSFSSKVTIFSLSWARLT